MKITRITIDRNMRSPGIASTIEEQEIKRLIFISRNRVLLAIRAGFNSHQGRRIAVMGGIVGNPPKSILEYQGQ